MLVVSCFRRAARGGLVFSTGSMRWRPGFPTLSCESSETTTRKACMTSPVDSHPEGVALAGRVPAGAAHADPDRAALVERVTALDHERRDGVRPHATA